MDEMIRVVIASLLISACCVVHALDVPCPQTVSSLPSSSPLTVAMVNEILRLHNEARYNTTPTASVMPPLQWSNDLASGAQGYLDGCPGFQHSSQVYRQNKFGFAYIGENLAAGMRFDLGGFATASRMWIDERKWWTYTAPTCTGSDVCGTCTADTSIGQSCGHYTQAIWSRSTHIGCGYKKCNTLEIYDCWYGPGGNIVRQGPFTAGTRDPSQTCPGTTNTTAVPSGTTASPPGGTTTTAAPPPSPGGTSVAATTTPAPAGPGGNNPAAPPAAGSSDDGGMSGGTVAGIVCACVGIAALLGGVVLMLVRMRRSSSADAEKSDVQEMMLASGAPSPPEGRSSGEATAGHSTRGLTTPVDVLSPSESAPPATIVARNRNGTFADL